MKALIIDENKTNRLYIRRLLVENFSVLKRIDEAESVAQALQSIEQSNYDVIFMEMEFSTGVGFDILKVVKEFVYVIVVSAHKEYAIEAIKHHVVDYILKPVNVLEFKNAVKRVIKLKGQEMEKASTPLYIDHKSNATESPNALMIHSNNAYVTVDIRSILYIKALGKNSQIYLNDNKEYTSNKNLKEFQNVMSQHLIRTHHSYLVNLKNIVSYSKDTSHVLLSGGVEVPVSVRKREELFRKFMFF